MAEAHEAVAFSFKVTEEGLDINVNKEALTALSHACKRSFKRGLARFKNKLINRVYPIRLSSWPLLTLVICFAIHIGYDFSQYGMTHLEDFSLKTLNIRTYSRLSAILLFSLIMWLSGVMLVRYCLRALFCFQGWVYETRGKMRLHIKIWMGLIHLLSSKEPRLYGYQNSLPKIPIPKVDDTISRYLLSVRPLLNDNDYGEMVQLATEFKNKISKKLQFFLHLKSFLTSNYISDWWEEYVYLHTRGPIMVNSNFYCIDYLSAAVPGSQTVKAANLIYLMLQHRRNIDKETLKPMCVNGVVPLCSAQYERQFNTTRIPGETKDSLVHYRDSRHVVVLHRGRYFRVNIENKNGLLRPVDIERSLLLILKDESESSEGEMKLGALTAAERQPWAHARKRFFSSGLNKSSLDIIDKAAFFVVLDDVEYHYDPEDDSKLNEFARAGLMGDCTNRWFDKSYTLFVGKNGMAGFNVEHSWGDGPITAYLWEYISSKNFLNRLNSDGFVGYTPDMHCVGTADDSLPPPYRMKWQISDECLVTINSSLESARSHSADIDLHLMVHREFGKGEMKKLNVSPDAFIQIGLQLAYFRTSGQSSFCLTYEACMTRLFKDGRTETVRSCTLETCEFVRALCASKEPITSLDPEDKIRLVHLFNNAADKHQNLNRDAMTGKGVDRHLFCLYVMSRYLSLKSPFLQRVLGEPWKLSTSQTPHNQVGLVSTEKYPDLVCAGGGFGPVADEGYGVSYIIAGENCIFFHVSSKHSQPGTNSLKFAADIKLALADLRKLLTKEKNGDVVKSNQ